MYKVSRTVATLEVLGGGLPSHHKLRAEVCPPAKMKGGGLPLIKIRADVCPLMFGGLK